jgi:EAL domain-containing protein (putative c-di-GMP-specific phosphodiesterase class I)/GGDEF domain-containing protein
MAMATSSPNSNTRDWLRHSLEQARGAAPDDAELLGLLRDGGLQPFFQPIAALADGMVSAHEALIRGPAGHRLHTPDALIAAARQAGLLLQFEVAAVLAALRSWRFRLEPGRLFVNLSASALQALANRAGVQALVEEVRAVHLQPRQLVVEITEHDRVEDMDTLAVVVSELRACGVGFALDDFGDGHSSLRLWSQIKPDIVKIDKYFTRDISRHAENLQTLRALMQIAHIFGSDLVAEGIETAEDLRVLRDLGVRYGQGYFLGRPGPVPMQQVLAQATEALQDSRLAVLPELRRVTSVNKLPRLAVIEAPTVQPETTHDELTALFLAHPALHAVAVVEHDAPLGLINRLQYMNNAARPYYRELFGRQSCMDQANLSPRLVELTHDVDELLGILTSEDQRYLSDGFIVTSNGRYVGLGTGDQIVRSVTEARIEAARHANPLTFLPGNIPITQHIDRLLERGVEFVACYADLNNFKPFNDQFGYWRGDEMIRLLAQVCLSQCDPRNDFVGHVGGDDFMLLLQRDDWHAACERIIADFNERALLLFDEGSRQRGGIEAEDRHGVMRFFPCTTLAIGAVPVQRGAYRSAEMLANQAALAKHAAKQQTTGLYVMAGSPTSVLID